MFRQARQSPVKLMGTALKSIAFVRGNKAFPSPRDRSESARVSAAG